MSLSEFSFFNQDGTFFSISSSDPAIKKLIAEDVISLTITEEIGRMISGSLVLWDQYLNYSQTMLPMKQLTLSWGIMQNFGNITPMRIQRQNVQVFTQSPSGGGDDKGQLTYSCNFMSFGMRGGLNKKTFVNTTKNMAIRQIMMSIGINPAFMDVRFVGDTETLTQDTALMQDESDFRCLVRYAFEWHARLMIGYTSTGLMAGAFISANYLSSTLFTKWVGSNATGFFEYGAAIFGETATYTIGEKANVISYTWRQNTSDSMGDNVRIVNINGQMNFIRTVASGEQVLSYRLVPERIAADFNRRGSTSDQFALMQEIVSAKSFKEVEKYFEPYRQPLAPQGAGFTLNIETLGNPYFTAGTIASFGKGFPSRIGSKDRTWYVRKCTHQISKAGYKCNFEIEDVYIQTVM